MGSTKELVSAQREIQLLGGRKIPGEGKKILGIDPKAEKKTLQKAREAKVGDWEVRKACPKKGAKRVGGGKKPLRAQ